MKFVSGGQKKFGFKRLYQDRQHFRPQFSQQHAALKEIKMFPFLFIMPFVCHIGIIMSTILVEYVVAKLKCQ